MVKLYWIRLLHHTDPYKEGYIGVTNRYNRRMVEYKCLNTVKSKRGYKIAEIIRTHGWSNLLISVLQEFSNYDLALKAENLHRPNPGIGWNVMAGGFNRGKQSEATKNKISNSMQGNKNTNGFSKEALQCPHCGKKGQKAAMKRWHFENCKYS
jgi:hypothetical protein